MSLSSETPVKRWFGTEILDHSKGSIDLSYAREAGLPLLFGHDQSAQSALIGRLEDVRLTDGQLVAMARFSSSPEGQQAARDVEDGILVHLSVGYRINTMVLAEQTDDNAVYRATDWTPMEGSFVAVPADINAKVRDAETGQAYPVSITEPVTRRKAEEAMPEAIQPTPAAVPATAGADRALDALAIAKLAEQFEVHGKRVTEALSAGMSPAEFAGKIFEWRKQDHVPAPAVKLTEKEDRQYSVTRALAGMAAARHNGVPWTGFEAEISNQIATGTKRSTDGFYMPMSIRASVTGQTAGTSSLGGAGVQTDIGDLVELLRNTSRVVEAGATVLTGLSNNLTLPRQITANTLSWTGENPSSGNTNTSATFNTIALTPKTAMVSTAVSRQFLLQFTPGGEEMTRRDIAAVIGLGVDLAALNGSGSSNQPTGLMQAGVTSITTTFSTNGAVPDWAAIVDFETQLAAGNAPGNVWKWMTTPGIRGKLKQVLKNTTSGASFIYDGDEMNGYQALVTNQMPSNFTYGTSTTICHGMALGYWPELIIAEFGGGLQILVDPYTVASQNMVQFHALIMVDIGVRHTASFAITKGAKTS